MTIAVSGAWPVELRLKRGARMLAVTFDDGTMAELPAELLRVESPSAEVRGHGASTKITVPGKRNVAIAAVEPIGNYAVRLCFDDGHDTGIYSWDLLWKMGRDKGALMSAYEKALADKGLSRDAT